MPGREGVGRALGVEVVPGGLDSNPGGVGVVGEKLDEGPVGVADEDGVSGGDAADFAGGLAAFALVGVGVGGAVALVLVQP
jgi:hypothetical protein